MGATGPSVLPFALGCMGMSGMYGPADATVGIATIHEAIDHGVSILDTGDFYGSGQNELLIGRALAGRRREQVMLSVKFGALRTPDGGWTGNDTRPAALKNFLAYSLVRLGVDYIDIYRPTRLDPAVPIEDTVGAIAELVKAGYVRHIGLSEVGSQTIRRAHAVHPIVDLQIEYSLISRGPEREIFPTLAELDVAVTAYGVLSRGLLSGSRPSTSGDFRAHLPRFTGENAERNRAVIDAFARVAAELGATPSQLAIAWVLARNPRVVPVIGARTPAQLAESLGALALRLSPADVERIGTLVSPAAIAGDRYGAQAMAALDSEK